MEAANDEDGGSVLNIRARLRESGKERKRRIQYIHI